MCVIYSFTYIFSLFSVTEFQIEKDVVRYAEDSPRYFSTGILRDSKVYVSRVMQSVIFGKIGNILVKEECRLMKTDKMIPRLVL